MEQDFNQLREQAIIQCTKTVHAIYDRLESLKDDEVLSATEFHKQLANEGLIPVSAYGMLKAVLDTAENAGLIHTQKGRYGGIRKGTLAEFKAKKLAAAEVKLEQMLKEHQSSKENV